MKKEPWQSREKAARGPGAAREGLRAVCADAGTAQNPARARGHGGARRSCLRNDERPRRCGR